MKRGLVELHVSPRLVFPEPAETFQSQPKLPVWGTTAPISKGFTDLLDAQYGNPVCVIGFNAAEGWSRECGRHAPRGGISPWSTWWAYCAMSRASVTTAAIALFPARSA